MPLWLPPEKPIRKSEEDESWGAALRAKKETLKKKLKQVQKLQEEILREETYDVATQRAVKQRRIEDNKGAEAGMLADSSLSELHKLGGSMPTTSKVWTSKPSMVGLAIRAMGTTDRRGKSLPEVRWLVDGQQRIYNILLRWAREVLKLPEARVPSSLVALESKGVMAFGSDGALPMEEQIGAIKGRLGAHSGHRLLIVQWPPQSLPAHWGVAAVERKIAPSVEGSSLRVCKGCGSGLVFRRKNKDDGMRTYAVCQDCDEVKGGFRAKRTADQSAI